MKKIFAISKDKKYYKIGESNDTSVWYSYDENIKEKMKSVNRGDEVEIKYDVKEENGRKQGVINFIKVTGKSSSSPTSSNSSSYNSSTDMRTRSIERQAMMKTAGEAVKAMPGQFESKEDLWGSIDFIYENMIRKITG